MPNSFAKRISPIGLKGEGGSGLAIGEAMVGFTVIDMDLPHKAVPGWAVTMNVEPYHKGESPQLSIDRTTWSSGVDVTTAANGEAWAYIRGGSKSGDFQISGAIEDFEEPYHKVKISGTAPVALTGVVFTPVSTAKTWQGKPFKLPAAVYVKTIPESKEQIHVQLSGPGSNGESANFSASFIDDGKQARSLESGGLLPAIQAGRKVGNVEIVASVDAISSATMTWTVLPVPDRLQQETGAPTQVISWRALATNLDSLPFHLTGHKVLGDTRTDSEQVVPVPDWPVRLSLRETTHATFNNGDDGGRTLTVHTGPDGKVVVPADKLTLKPVVSTFTLSIRAEWNMEPDLSGEWHTAGPEGTIELFVGR